MDPRPKLRSCYCAGPMPRMGGPEALLEMRRVRPEVPVILCSGYDESRVGGASRGDGPDAFLKKPFRLAGLAEVLRRVLAPADGA